MILKPGQTVAKVVEHNDVRIINFKKLRRNIERDLTKCETLHAQLVNLLAEMEEVNRIEELGR